MKSNLFYGALEQSRLEGGVVERASVPLFQMARWETFDMLRALAMVFVFLYHYAGFLSPLTQGAPWLDAMEELVLQLGSIGTNLFLLLAGLFVARSVARDNFRYEAFLARRVIRIYPPYLLVVLAALLFWLLFPAYAKFRPGATPFSVFWENLFLIPGLFPQRPALTVTWTLSWIMAAYVVLPLPLIALRRLAERAWWRIAILSGVLLVYVVLACYTSLGSPRVGYLLAGCVIFELVTIAPVDYAGHRRMARMLLLGGTALLLRIAVQTAGAWGVYEAARRVLSTSLGLCGLSLLAVAAFIAQLLHPLHYYQFPWNPIRQLGRIGFSFYLLHGPVTKLFAFQVLYPLPRLWDKPYAGWLVMPVCFLAAGAASAALFFWIERPLQRLGKAYF